MENIEYRDNMQLWKLEAAAREAGYQKPRETREWDGAALAEAMAEELPPIPGMAPTAMAAALHADMERAAKQHAPGVTCRLNRTTWRVEYIDAAGNLVI